jgi:hypothetical protein
VQVEMFDEEMPSERVQAILEHYAKTRDDKMQVCACKHRHGQRQTTQHFHKQSAQGKIAIVAPCTMQLVRTATVNKTNQSGLFSSNQLQANVKPVQVLGPGICSETSSSLLCPGKELTGLYFLPCQIAATLLLHAGSHMALGHTNAVLNDLVQVMPKGGHPQQLQQGHTRRSKVQLLMLQPQAVAGGIVNGQEKGHIRGLVGRFGHVFICRPEALVLGCLGTNHAILSAAIIRRFEGVFPLIIHVLEGPFCDMVNHLPTPGHVPLMHLLLDQGGSKVLQEGLVLFSAQASSLTHSTDNLYAYKQSSVTLVPCGMQACCWQLPSGLCRALKLTGELLSNRSWVVQKHPVCGCLLSHYLENVKLTDEYCPGCHSNSRWHKRAYRSVIKLVAKKYRGFFFLPELPLLQLPGKNLQYADLVIAPPAQAAQGHLLAVELDSELHDEKPIRKKGEDIVDARIRVREEDDAKDALYRKLGWGVYRLKWSSLQPNGWIEKEAVKALDQELQKAAGLAT